MNRRDARTPGRGTGRLIGQEQADLRRLAALGFFGRLVRRLVRGVQPAGAHRVSWDGRDHAGGQAAAGVYFVKLRAGSRELAGRIARIR